MIVHCKEIIKKVLEESPSAAIGHTLRNEITAAAVKAAQHVSYENAGTIEFLLDESSGKFYFMEMNTRVQVEHPVTEFVSGVDIVKEQIRVANGNELSVKQEDVTLVDMRLNVELMRKILNLILHQVQEKLLIFSCQVVELVCGLIALCTVVTVFRHIMIV